MPLQDLYPLLYIAPNFNSSYILKITEVKLLSNSWALEFILFVKYTVRKDIDADWFQVFHKILQNLQYK